MSLVKVSMHTVDVFQNAALTRQVHAWAALFCRRLHRLRSRHGDGRRGLPRSGRVPSR